MDELRLIVEPYSEIDLAFEFHSLESLVAFSKRFYRDTSEIFDCLTRIRNMERDPDGFSVNDAAILGLLVRSWKILKEICCYYEQDKADILSMFDRQLIESVVTAKYLLLSDETVVEDYRRCGYKSRLQLLTRAEESPPFFDTPPGQRLVASVHEKLARDGFSRDSFGSQRKNRWRLQGKSFYEIFREVEDEDLYKHVYGMPSESVHGSWPESLDFHLLRDESGLFRAHPHYQPVDPRWVGPLIRYCNDPYHLWLKRIEIEDPYVDRVLRWVSDLNTRVFLGFEPLYTEHVLEKS